MHELVAARARAAVRGNRDPASFMLEQGDKIRESHARGSCTRSARRLLTRIPGLLVYASATPSKPTHPGRIINEGDRRRDEMME